MTGDASQVDIRLRRLAVDYILPTGLNVSTAVALAEDLVASGHCGRATVEVAALHRQATLSDAAEPVRQMLAEHGLDVPQPGGEEDSYEVLLRAFGYWDLPADHVERVFYSRVPDWEHQGPLDRALVALLDRRDQAMTPQAKSVVEEEMRAVVRDHIANG